MLSAPRRDGQVRIIGGAWRGRRLRFVQVDGLRPTPDRVRETLFNWLQSIIPGARCLDLFAGSGALGFEALSRGAAQVVWIERHALAVGHLVENLSVLGATGGSVVRADVLAWLRGPARPFDVVFVDPPFDRKLLAPVCSALEKEGWLKPGAYVYLESEAGSCQLALPDNWEIVRHKRAGQVDYRLAHRAR
jgi:16S rRNA (guanine966-N2)-methyltransferase